MKLVAAKCPNCGANLDVNPGIEAIKCEYCKSAILVDDAIKKYKYEISGNVEISNLPKVKDLLKNASKYYKEEKYEKAYELYGKVLELDSENVIATLRYGICKNMVNNYIDFTLDYLSDSFKNGVDLLKRNDMYEENIESYVNEVCSAIDSSLDKVTDFYNSYIVNQYELSNIQIKIYSIIKCYELILKYTKKMKKHILNQLLISIDDYIKDKNYKTGTDFQGSNFTKIYKIDKDEKKKFNDKYSKYLSMLNNNGIAVSDNSKNNIDKNGSNTAILPVDADAPKKDNFFIKYSINIFLLLYICISALVLDIVSSVVVTCIFLIYNELIYKEILSNKKYKEYIIFGFIVALVICICLGI